MPKKMTILNNCQLCKEPNKIGPQADIAFLFVFQHICDFLKMGGCKQNLKLLCQGRYRGRGYFVVQKIVIF